MDRAQASRRHQGERYLFMKATLKDIAVQHKHSLFKTDGI
jgi:hypothetical protein